MLEYEDELASSIDGDLLYAGLELYACFTDPARCDGALLRIELFLGMVRLLWNAFPGRNAISSIMLGSLSSRMSCPKTSMRPESGLSMQPKR